jgi:thiamine-monophosphate kinase
MSDIKKTEISSIGEFGLIERITKNTVLQNKSTLKGVGDDAAVLSYPEKNIVVTTDLLVEGIHFNLMYVPLKHLGYKAVTANLSDVYAMNAAPKQILVSIAVSGRFPVEAIDELYEGIHSACEKYGVDLVGGDTTSSVTGLVISITAIGETEKGRQVYRNSANENDLICVSGNLGAAYAGLQLLERENEIFKSNPEINPQLAGYEYILQRQLKPEARKDMIEFFEKSGILPTSMIDISDGLSSEILHICKQSGKGCIIYEERIPIDEETRKFAKELELDPNIFAMNGGEDYELLFTISQTDYEKIKTNSEITIIGHITKSADKTLLSAGNGNSVEIKALGWDAHSG